MFRSSSRARRLTTLAIQEFSLTLARKGFERSSMVLFRHFHSSTPNYVKASKNFAGSTSARKSSKKASSKKKKSNHSVTSKEMAQQTERPVERTNDAKTNWALNDEEYHGKNQKSWKDPAILLHHASFHAYDLESPELPEKVQIAIRKDSTYFHGREGLGTQWSLPSVKPSGHPAVRAILDCIYFDRKLKG